MMGISSELSTRTSGAGAWRISLATSLASRCCVCSSAKTAGAAAASISPNAILNEKLAMVSLSLRRRAARRMLWPFTRVPFVLPRSRSSNRPSVLTMTQWSLETLLWSRRRSHSSLRPTRVRSLAISTGAPPSRGISWARMALDTPSLRRIGARMRPSAREVVQGRGFNFSRRVSRIKGGIATASRERSSRLRCFVLRRDAALKPEGDLINLLGIEHLIVALEQAGDGGLVDLHLGLTDADGAVAQNTVALSGLVHHLDAFDSQGRHGIQIDGDARHRTGLAFCLRQKDNAGGAGGNHKGAAVKGFG